ncbi:MAG TPA: pentapeptide repeat-containing protein, partial [Bacteroidales bacterium]|nr:pentapeptide repeat-containing protein [Bacteroidales bacterium]
SDLKRSSFIKCDLQRSVFRNTDLEGVDFSSSFNYSIDPSSNRIKKARFAISGLPGLLDKFDIEIEE